MEGQIPSVINSTPPASNLSNSLYIKWYANLNDLFERLKFTFIICFLSSRLEYEKAQAEF